MKTRLKIVAVALTASLAAGPRLWADDVTDQIKALQQQIQELDQKVRVLEREHELDQDASKETVKTLPVVTAGANGFSFRSADTNFVLSLHGVLQLDNRSFFRDDGTRGNEGFILRRARPILQGTVFRDFDFMFVPDFGGSTVQIFDAYLNYRYSPELQLEAGKFKSPVGLEALQTDRDILFNERSIATDLMPNRDLGVMLHGDVGNGVISYAAALLNGAPDYSGTTTNADYDNFLAFAGRAFAQPFKRTPGFRSRAWGSASPAVTKWTIRPRTPPRPASPRDTRPMASRNCLLTTREFSPTARTGGCRPRAITIGARSE